MKFYRHQFLILLIFTTLSNFAMASHCSGGYITIYYSGIGNNYLVKYVFYRDCSFSALNSITAQYSWNNGANQGTMSLINISSSVPVGTCMPASGISCINWIGIEEIIYIGSISLSSNNIYYFTIFDNFLSGISTVYNLPGGALLISKAMINLQSAPGNSLPDFNAQPQFYFCLNQLFSYNNSVKAFPGDSIAYSMVPINDDTANITSYIPPYSYSNFISSASSVYFDSLTGFVSFTPNLIQNGWLAVKIEDYRNGILIGSIMRQAIMHIVNGTVSVPELKDELAIEIFPNPAIDFLHIDQKLQQGKLNWVITESTGRVLKKSYDLEYINNPIPIKDIKPGIYLITFNDGESLISKKFVKE